MCSISNRIRKIKCDEGKPSCQKCASTGRACDGYESPFRIVTSQIIDRARAGGVRSDDCLITHKPDLVEIAPASIDLLNRCFSTKTLFDVQLDCDEEALQVLRASFTDSPIRHAISSLKALRKDLETSGDNPASVAQQTPTYHYGLQQYNMALRGLASDMSLQGSNGVKPALLCCQLFISIEQVQKNYASMAQHIIQGLRIMHQYQARPSLIAPDSILPAYHTRLPYLDVFIIKLFAAPCKFADPPTGAGIDGMTSSGCLESPRQEIVKPREHCIIAPNMRTKLTTIAASTLVFLSNVEQIETVEVGLRLMSERAALLDSLASWCIDLELVQTEAKNPDPEPISMSFLRFFHAILSLVLRGALQSSLHFHTHTKLQSENDRLQRIANSVDERVRTYRTCIGNTGTCSVERSTRPKCLDQAVSLGSVMDAAY